MDNKTLLALKDSIAKWEKIVDGTGKDCGPENCALCQLFAQDAAKFCVGCPVFSKTGNRGCTGTPYDNWDHLSDEVNKRDELFGLDDVPIDLLEVARALARAELDFLKSLLPE